jgi:hypothetical protein
MTNPDRDDLNRLLDPMLPTWLLIDPILGEPLHIDVAEHATCAQLNQSRSRTWQRDIQPIALRSEIDLPHHLHPYLVAMNGVDDPWLVDSLILAGAEHEAAWQDGLAGRGRAAWRLGGWLQCERGAEQLAHTLAGLMRVQATTPTKARYLRLADRRTLDSLCWIVGACALAASFGTIRRWTWLDSCNRLQSLEHSSQDQEQELLLNASQWATLMRSELIHPCVARWLGEMSDEVGALCLAQSALQRAHAAVQVALRASRKWPASMAAADNVIAWAAMSLLHPDFDTHPAYLRWLGGLADSQTDAPPEPFNIYCHELRALLAQQNGTVS